MAFSVATHVALSTAAHGHVATQTVGSCQDVPPFAVSLMIFFVLLMPISIIVYAVGERISDLIGRHYRAAMYRRRQALADHEFAEQDRFVRSRLSDEIYSKSKMQQCKEIYEIVGGDRVMFLRQAMRITNITKAGAATYYQNIKMHSVYRKQ